MVLSDAKTLETLVAGNEIESAIKALQDSALTDKLDGMAEAISPVIEQHLDAEAYESTSYSIELSSYQSAEYSAKSQYELADRDDETVGASMTAIYNEYEHDLLVEAQEIASNTRQGDNTNNPFVEAQVDFNMREKKNSIKLVSLTLWQSMYDGKLIYN